MVAMAEGKAEDAHLRKRGSIARLRKWRTWVQAAFLLVWLDPLMLRMHSVCGTVFHCYSCPLALFACPVGVVANFSALHVIPFLAFGTLLLVGSLVGSMLCGWACPFGFLQDLLGRVPVPKVRLPAWTGYMRYVVLVGLVLAVPFLWGKEHPLFICSVCPAGAIEAAAPHMVQAAGAGQQIVWPNAIKLVVTVLVLTGAFVTWRPWCRLFCPLGAAYGLMNRASLVMLKFRGDRCIHCGLCRGPCRYGVTPEKRLNDSRCIRCLECTRCGAISLGAALGGGEGRIDPDVTAGAGRKEADR
jgi:polyferredoxin